MPKLRQRSSTYVALALALVAAAVFIHRWDYVFQDWLQPHRIHRVSGTWHGDLMRVIRPLGKGNVIIVLALFFGACGLKRRAIEILAALAIVGILVFPTKKMADRTRPSGANQDSFPSGDTAGVSAAAVPLVAHSARWIPVAGLLVPAVAALRVLDNNHYLSDVLAGMALGLIAAAIAMALRLDRRWRFAKLRYRHLALLSVSLAMVWYIPGLIRGRGTFFDFAMVFGPVLIYRQCLVYLPFRFQWPHAHVPSPGNRFAGLKKALLAGSMKLPAIRSAAYTGGYGRAVAYIPLVILAVVMVHIWCLHIQHLKLALAGMLIYLAFCTATISRLMQNGRQRYAAGAMIGGGAFLLYFLTLHILPEAYRCLH
jgi:membrane-associated phospholipid phosphatase